MTDLTYCYVHMRRTDILVLDTVGTPDYLDIDLDGTTGSSSSSDEDQDKSDFPKYLLPPDPDNSETALPNNVHPSFPYGDPSQQNHPAKKPRPIYDPSSRALFEDMGLFRGGVNERLRWTDLGLDDILPIDQDKEMAKRAIQARKMASGAAHHNPQAQQQAQVAQMQQIDDDEEDEEGDEEENDENTIEYFEEEEEEEEEEESEGEEE